MKPLYLSLGLTLITPNTCTRFKKNQKAQQSKNVLEISLPYCKSLSISPHSQSPLTFSCASIWISRSSMRQVLYWLWDVYMSGSVVQMVAYCSTSCIFFNLKKIELLAYIGINKKYFFCFVFLKWLHSICEFMPGFCLTSFG